jgi:hypothetical protein
MTLLFTILGVGFVAGASISLVKRVLLDTRSAIVNVLD